MQYIVHINVTALFSTEALILKQKAILKFTVQSYQYIWRPWEVK